MALVLCLNIGVDPPDAVKTAASKQCWLSKKIPSHDIYVYYCVYYNSSNFFYRRIYNTYKHQTYNV